MGRTRIKICGITHPDDAALAAEAGADAIGLVFHPQARRAVTIEQARRILKAVPPFVAPVALFVDQPIETMRQIVGMLGIRHVQLHGHESVETVTALQGCCVLKAVKAGRDSLEADLTNWRRAIAERGLSNLGGILLETPAAAPGGTGIANDWAYIEECRQRGLFDALPPLIAAGGLTPETVGGVVRMLRPHAVDVSSGVEATFGRKDPERVRAFIAAVREEEFRV